MPTAEVDGAQLAYKVDGHGAGLVLVHAGIADMRMWDPLVALLDHRFRIVRYDMRGHRRDDLHAPASPRDAEDLAALLTALDIDACTLVGASFGGLVALDFASKHPERVERLVVIDPPLPESRLVGGHDVVLRGRERGDRGGAHRRGGAAQRRPVRPAGASSDVQALVADMQERAFRLQLELEPEGPGPAPELANITMPTTVVMGENDVQDFIAIAHRLADEVPPATLRVRPADESPAGARAPRGGRGADRLAPVTLDE